MYQALYRKWRPKVFEDVAGQPRITAALRNEVAANRVAHAYLFTGSRGTGKTTCAKIMAKAVNCLRPVNGDPCNECENCRGIESATLLDVVEIDAASNNGVDNIRDLREETSFTPVSAKYRVYIIDEAHMLSTGAFNALLKTLEEPPSYVIFILATTEVHKIPATILSRCQRFDFRRIPADDIAARLQYVAGQEKLTLEPQAASLIARLSDGGLRDALSLLDQCAAGEYQSITEESVYQAAGLTDREYLFELSEAIGSADPARALRTLDRLHAASKDMERLCEELILQFRNVMVLQSVRDADGLINCPPEEEAKLSSLAGIFHAEAVLHILDTLQMTLDVLRRSPSRRVEMEMCLLRLCRPELDQSTSALLRRLSAMEEKLSSLTAVRAGGAKTVNQPAQTEKLPVPPAKTISSDTITASAPILAPVNPDKTPEQPAETAAPENPEVLQEDIRLESWPDILKNLASSDPPLCGVLNGSGAIVRGNHVLVDASNSMFSSLIRQQTHQKALVEAIRSITGQPYKVGIFKKSLKEQPVSNDPMDEILKNAGTFGIEVKEK